MASEFPVHLLSMSRIVVDHELQSRVETHAEYQQDFADAMLRGDEFPPVTTFFDGSVYWLADGFHRFGARRIAAETDVRFELIKAEVRTGTRDDARIFSAGANQKFSIPRTKEDVRKAVEMLLGYPEWIGATAVAISKHCGVSAGTAIKVRAAYCQKHGITIEELTDSIGRTKRLTNRASDKDRFYARKRMRGGVEVIRYECRVDGKLHILGYDESDARARHETLLRESKGRRRRGLNETTLETAGAPRGILFERFMREQATRYRGLRGLVGHGFLATTCAMTDDDTFPEAIGRLVLAQSFLDRALQPVVVAYIDGTDEYIANLAKKVGIWVMDPDEFLEAAQRYHQDAA
jgi:hypothetical protein